MTDAVLAAWLGASAALVAALIGAVVPFIQSRNRLAKLEGIIAVLQFDGLSDVERRFLNRQRRRLVVEFAIRDPMASRARTIGLWGFIAILLVTPFAAEWIGAMFGAKPGTVWAWAVFVAIGLVVWTSFLLAESPLRRAYRLRAIRSVVRQSIASR